MHLRLLVLPVLLTLIGCSPLQNPAGQLPTDWKSLANAGIERHRKRDAEVTLVDAAGKPVAGAALNIHETHKAFPFGSAISGNLLNNRQWQQAFLAHFNTAVLENESKWTQDERVRGQENYRTADQLVAWCQTNNIAVRGHCLLYEGRGGQPNWLANLSADDLRAAIERRLTNASAHFQNKFISWDVDNEMLHGTPFRDALGPDARAGFFKRARELNPNTQLFTNDFNVLSVDQNFKQVQTQEYVDHVKALLAQGAPITGIGIQGHLWTEDILANPEVIRQRLDLVASLHIPIWISEFDAADADPAIRADKLELVYRTAFGNPEVQGIMMWVFWAGNSWRGDNAALFNRDWTMNEEGKRFEALMAEWTTNATLHTDGGGRARFRGFFGTYNATVQLPNQPSRTMEFTLDAGEKTQSIHLGLDK